MVREYNYHDDIRVISDSVVPRFIGDNIIFYYFFLGDEQSLPQIGQLNQDYNLPTIDLLNPDERLHSFILSEESGYLCFISELARGTNTIACFDGDSDHYFEPPASNPEDIHSYPFFSGDGKMLYYYVHRDDDYRAVGSVLYRYNLNGSNEGTPELVSDCLIEPSVMSSNIGILSADGEWLVFAGECEGVSGIFRLNGHHYSLLYESTSIVGQPTLIENDSEIIFIADSPEGVRDIYWMDLSNTSVINLTFGENGDYFWYPIYSDNGQKLVANNGSAMLSFERNDLIEPRLENVEAAGALITYREVADYGLFPSFSNDGSALSYLWEGGVYRYSYETTTTIEVFPNYSTEPVITVGE